MKINQPKIIAQTQEFVFDEVHIVGGGAVVGKVFYDGTQWITQ
jgi:hypothetical protein